jgi:hypothetical protein
MQALIVDEGLTLKLEAAKEPIEIVARDGRRLGFFVPGPPRKYHLDPKILDEELQARDRRTEGRTLAQIMVDLDKLS